MTPRDSFLSDCEAPRFLGSTYPDVLGESALRKELFTLASKECPTDSLPMKESSLRLLMTTFSDRESATAVVRSLLEERLIACGSILPGVTSFYHWEGDIMEAPEVVVLMKTEQANSKSCMVRLQELHPYEVPEIILLDPEVVSEPYAGWVMEVLGGAKF